MDEIIQDIIALITSNQEPTDEALERIIRRHNRNRKPAEHWSKKMLLPYYLEVKNNQPKLFNSWHVNDKLERQILKLLQMKPRRTASGVATITVITKPEKCSSACIYCPNDIRMPKSYLHMEPACQRAERNYFDPYLQTTSRLHALEQMGHITDKIEIIILGGTWSDYSKDYQIWFVKEIFRALNEDSERAEEYAKRSQFYQDLGISNDSKDLQAETALAQEKINEGKASYNEAFESVYQTNPSWLQAAKKQKASFEELEFEQKRNESSTHRMVGLVIETRPDKISADSLRLIRRLGCTKVQIGIQSLRQDVLDWNRRGIRVDQIAHAFDLLRIFGFKIHTHFMVNLLGSDPESDKADYKNFVTDARFLPDEVKLYPCVVVEGTPLNRCYRDGRWKPYSEDTLIEILKADLACTPPFTRISRVIRDISTEDILAGNRKNNLRQLVDESAVKDKVAVAEIRTREVATHELSVDDLELEVVPYTTSNTQEYFLQWVDADKTIAGFLRLSLPSEAYVQKHQNEIPVSLGDAMIREVHVYGRVAHLHHTNQAVQHLGLGKKLVEKACEIAREAGFSRIQVISSVGTRNYYRKLGFSDGDLYQEKSLSS
ncbi:MAG: elongator complex protein 3 [Eggerthellaceae bacterium]|jgi:elongator complex protein 3